MGKIKQHINANITTRGLKRDILNVWVHFFAFASRYIGKISGDYQLIKFHTGVSSTFLHNRTLGVRVYSGQTPSKVKPLILYMVNRTYIHKLSLVRKSFLSVSLCKWYVNFYYIDIFWSAYVLMLQDWISLCYINPYQSLFNSTDTHILQGIEVSLS